MVKYGTRYLYLPLKNTFTHNNSVYNMVRYCMHMPTNGYKTITVSTEVYDLIERIYRKRKPYGRVRSRTQIVEEAILEYAKRKYPDLFAEYVTKMSEKV